MSISETILGWILAPIIKEIRKVEIKMSELSDKVAVFGVALDAHGVALETLGTDLQTEIAEINAKLAAGSVTPEDLANLTALSDRLSAMSGQVSGLSATVKGIVTP